MKRGGFRTAFQTKAGSASAEGLEKRGLVQGLRQRGAGINQPHHQMCGSGAKFNAGGDVEKYSGAFGGGLKKQD